MNFSKTVSVSVSGVTYTAECAYVRGALDEVRVRGFGYAEVLHGRIVPARLLLGVDAAIQAELDRQAAADQAACCERKAAQRTGAESARLIRRAAHIRAMAA